MTDWTVVTVTYNSEEHIARHWPAVNREAFKWIVVDNGSVDGTRERAARLSANVIKSGGNLGFSAANNIGLKAVDTPYVVFVNPDVSIQGDDWTSQLKASIGTRALVAPQLLNLDGSEQPNARGLPFLSSKIRNRLDPHSARGLDYARSGFTEPTYCAWAMGAALAGRTEVFHELGGWNDKYFLYYEDHEIGLRAWRYGVPVMLDPQVRWLHAWQRATTRPNPTAWRVEIASMRTFYAAHPEFLRGKRSLKRLDRIRHHGYDEMVSRLWTSADAP